MTGVCSGASLESRDGCTASECDGSEPQGAAQLYVTVFANKRGTKIEAEGPLTLEKIETLISTIEPAANKDELRLLKLGRFGSARTKSGCLRHNENMEELSGLEIDYDGEEMSILEGANRLKEYGIEGLFYSSPSSTREKPRWRGLFPFSTPIVGTPKELKEARDHWCGVVNAILDSAIGRESFTLSQTYFFGPIINKPHPDVFRISGQPIDTVQKLPAPDIPGTRKKTGPKPTPRNSKTTAEEDILSIATGEHIRGPTLRLTARGIAKGLSVVETTEYVHALHHRYRAAWSHNLDLWSEINGKTRRMAEDAQQKYGAASHEEVSTLDVELSRFPESELLSPIRPERYALPGLVPIESYTLISGALSSFKTTFLHYLLVAKATGFDSLGIFDDMEIEPGPVILLNYEDSDPRILRRFQLLVQHQRNTLLVTSGSQAADTFMRRLQQNLRRITLTGRSSGGIVTRVNGAVAPNKVFLEMLLESIGEFARENLTIAIDPLRLATTGSQNDDDGADTVVHVLNMLANAYSGSAVIVTSHTTKAQAKEGSEATKMEAAYATSGSALYSQHARSNLYLARMSSKAIRNNFSPKDCDSQAADAQSIVKLTHGRLSHGLESGNRFFKMERGILLPVTPLPDRNSAKGIRNRFVPILLRVLARYNEADEFPSKATLENDPEAISLVGRNSIRQTIKLSETDGLIRNVGTPNRHAYKITETGAETLVRQNLAETASIGERQTAIRSD